jgi:thioredoxin 1
LLAPPRESPPVSRSTLPKDKTSSPSPEARIAHADEATFAELVLKSQVPVLVDFYADWCGPCQQLAPVLEQVASEMPGARIVKVNIDHSPTLATEYGVDSIPSLKVFKNGKVTDEIVGLASKNEVRAMLVR